jgi:acyl carrier protein
MSIEEKIREFVLKSLYFDEDAIIESDTSFLEQGIIDSRGVIELVSFVETEFQIKVEMSEMIVSNFDSIQKLASFVGRKLGVADSFPTSALADQAVIAGSVPQITASEPN